MTRTLLGYDAAGQPVFLTPEQCSGTHLHVLGGSGTGKSKFLEHFVRQSIRAGHGVCVLDWHGTLYADLVRWCAWLDIGLRQDFRDLILIDPTQDAFVTPLNFFARRGADIATQVSRRISAVVKVWGARNADAMPTFERVSRQIFTFAVEQEESLVNAARLLDFDRPDLRAFAKSTTGDAHVQAQWGQLMQVKTLREWHDFTLSTENRLTRFVGSHTLKRFLGLTESCLDLRGAMDQGAIILVNLGESDYLSRDEARVFAALFLVEFFEAAMRRAASRPRLYTVVFDEFQQYISDDLAAMLDEVRKGGLSLVLAHQHLGHFADNPRLEKAVFTNARNRVVFGGLDFEDASKVANEVFLHDLNTRQIKKAIYHTIHVFEEQTRIVRGSSSTTSGGSGSGSGSSSSSGSSEGSSDPVEGWFGNVNHPGMRTTSQFSTSASSANQSSFDSESATESWTEIPVWVPCPKRELASETEWTREEKLSKIVELLKFQQRRHAFIKLGTERTQPLLVPFVHDRRVSRDALADYVAAIYKRQGALTGAEADRLLKEREIALLDRVRRYLNPAPVEIRSGRRTVLERKK
jgi:hypothetical protein